MTPTSNPSLALLRRQLVAEARADIYCAMERVVPFVLSHPGEAGVLSELGEVASTSAWALHVFRSVVSELVGTAARAENSARPRSEPSADRDFDVVAVGGAA